MYTSCQLKLSIQDAEDVILMYIKRTKNVTQKGYECKETLKI